MSAHHDLIVQAKHLVDLDRGKPKQINLRRAVSNAYYALFHLLTSEASSRFLTGGGRDDIRMMVRRSFSHGAMNEVCKDIAKPNLPQRYQTVFRTTGVPLRLKNVAQAFVDLQQARHDADYNFALMMYRLDARDSISQAESAMADWAAIRKTVPADAFLMKMLLSRRGNPSD